MNQRDRILAKVRLNCPHCGSPLSDGAYQCFASSLSCEASCRNVFCSRCAQHHRETFDHETIPSNYLNGIIATGTFTCPFDGCGLDVPSNQFTQHLTTCPHRVTFDGCRLDMPSDQSTQHLTTCPCGVIVCPVCHDFRTSNGNGMRLHFLTDHQFTHCQLNYDVLMVNDISKARGCLFSGEREDIVFFIRGTSLYSLCLSASAAPSSAHASSAPSAHSSSSQGPSDMVNLVTDRTQMDCGCYTTPALARCKDAVHLINFGAFAGEDAFRISLLIHANR